MLGQPKFNYGDFVCIKFSDGMVECGTIEIIDAYGTFFNQNEVCYDILVTKDDGTKVLYKHISEQRVYEVS